MLQIFIKIFWHNHIIIFWFFCLISRSKISLGDLQINPYHTLQRDSLYCPSSTILCYFLEMDANLTGLFLFNFESTTCKNHSDTNLVKIHSAVIEILSFSCSALFLVTAAILESLTAKKRIYTRNILTQRRVNFNQWVLRYCHFRVYAILVAVPGGHLG